MKNDKATQKVISEIHDKLNIVESHLMWLIASSQRFRVGQRVEFSRRAIRVHFVPKTRVKVRGTVQRLDSFSVHVAWDDRKHPQTLHHGFLNPVSGQKLF